MLWQWLHYAPDSSVTRSDLYAMDTNTASGSSTMHRCSRKLSSETSGIETGPARRAPTPQESVHSSSDRDLMVAQTGPSLSPVAHSRGTHSESAKRASASTVPEQAVRMCLIILKTFHTDSLKILFPESSWFES
jgi:hypothetical protein